MRTVIVYGPQGSGKSQAAARLQQRMGCVSVVDGWTPEQPLKPGALHLCQQRPAVVRLGDVQGVEILPLGDVLQPAAA